jgi:hypothetical protein
MKHADERKGKETESSGKFESDVTITRGLYYFWEPQVETTENISVQFANIIGFLFP